MRELDPTEINFISGGDGDGGRLGTYKRIGGAFADGYNWAIGKTTDLIEWTANLFK